MVKGIDSAFDHMELCSVLQDEVLKRKLTSTHCNLSTTATYGTA